MFKLLVRCLYNCQTHTDRFVQRAPPIHRGHVRTHWRLSSVINASILVNYAADRDPLWLTDERRDAVPFHPIYISNNERFQRFETGGQICDEIWMPIRSSNFFSVRYHRKCVYSRNSFFSFVLFSRGKEYKQKGFFDSFRNSLKILRIFRQQCKKNFFQRESIKCGDRSRNKRIFRGMYEEFETESNFHRNSRFLTKI